MLRFRHLGDYIEVKQKHMQYGREQQCSDKIFQFFKKFVFFILFLYISSITSDAVIRGIVNTYTNKITLSIFSPPLALL